MPVIMPSAKGAQTSDFVIEIKRAYYIYNMQHSNYVYLSRFAPQTAIFHDPLIWGTCLTFCIVEWMPITCLRQERKDKRNNFFFLFPLLNTLISNKSIPDLIGKKRAIISPLRGMALSLQLIVQIVKITKIQQLYGY